MAGVKGRSGGARPGAGRPKKPPVVTELADPLDFLRAVWKGELDPSPAQVKAAAAALPYVHPRKAPGKKEEGAPKAAGSKYAARQGPRLVSSR